MQYIWNIKLYNNDKKINKNNKDNKNKLITQVETIEQTIKFKTISGKDYTLTFKTKSHITKLSIQQLENLLSCIDISRFIKLQK